MAQNNPWNYHIAPYCHRLLVPLIVNILPFSIEINFFGLTFFSLLITSILTYYLLKSLNFSTIESLSGILLFYSLSWVVKFLIWDFWLVDSMLFLFILICLNLMVRNKDIMFAVFLFFAVMIKESALFLIPVYYTYNSKQFLDYRLILKTIVLCAPSISIFLLIRFAIPTLNNDASYTELLPGNLTVINPYDIISVFSFENFSNFDFKKLYTLTLGSFGVTGLLSIIGGRVNLSYLKKFYPLLILAYSQLFFAVNIQRLIVISFPLMIILSVNTLKTFRERNIKLSIILFLISINIFISIIWDDVYWILKLQTVFSLTAFIFVLLLYKFKRNWIAG